jgi:predicted AAA+ superfamily ATPase
MENTHPRYAEAQIAEDLTRKMVFVAGPRQVGKTTLARRLLPDPAGYLNWDVRADRDRIVRQALPDAPVWAFDELHKFRGWRGWLKGVWDGRREGQCVLVTGSARLDLYRRGGESLQGRYHLIRLHPLTLAEVGGARLSDLLHLGGFPEPFFGGDATAARRWSREHRQRLVLDELADLERIVDLAKVEQLMVAVPDRVGSPLSINALREDLQVAHGTASAWLEALERLYAIFRLAPFTAGRLRSVRKERKHYHFDWTAVRGDGPRFENLVAAHLLKWVHWLQDTAGRDVDLRYYRDVDGREVDFVVVEGQRPILLVEAKWADAPIDRGLRLLHERFPEAAAWQVSATGTADYATPSGLRVAPAEKLLGTLA